MKTTVRMPETIPDMAMFSGWCKDADVQLPELLRPMKDPCDVGRLPFTVIAKGGRVLWNRAEVWKGFSEAEHGILFALALVEWEQAGGRLGGLLFSVARDSAVADADQSTHVLPQRYNARVVAFWDALGSVHVTGALAVDLGRWQTRARREIGSRRRCKAVWESPLTPKGMNERGLFMERAAEPQ